MRCWIVLLIAIMLGGCRQPLRVFTDSRVSMATPLQACVKVDAPLNTDAGPVLEVPLHGACLPKNCTRIAVVDVDGLLLNRSATGPYSQGENPVAIFREKLDAISATPQIRAIVVRINSPGGGVTASDIMWQDLKRFRERDGRPVVACVMDIGAGGAYYLATAADQIVAHPTSLVGGIGVVWNSYNLRDLMALYNIIPQTIKAGDNIDMGTSQDALSPETRQMLQSMADGFHNRFREVVRAARPQISETSPIFDGRVLAAGAAREAGLVDEIGYLDDAIELARRVSGQPQAEVVMLRRRSTGAHSQYDVLPNTPLQETAFPLRMPGLNRSELPTFLYLWQPEPTLGK
jgi:protease-4